MKHDLCLKAARKMSWVYKKTPDEKKAGRRLWHKRRLLKAPTRNELFGRVEEYCQERKLSLKAQEDITNLLRGRRPLVIDEDYRKIAKADRIPRSLLCIDTPPRYWDIFI